MAWIKVECSVARNRKFVKAGPGPSWLWLCGLAYCQEGLTNGFIPVEALDYLGVKNARHLVKHVVAAGLWDATDGGWLIHDYLAHNKSASDVHETKALRASGGKLGGRPKKNLPENLRGLPTETLPETHDSVAVGGSAAAAVAVADLSGRGSGETDSVMDVWARELVALYPAQGRCGAHLVEPPLFAVLTSDASVTPLQAWDALKVRLAGHKRSHQWSVKQMVPRLDRYLRDGAHLQELPEHPVSTLVNDKTVRTQTSGAAFVAGGRDGAE